MEHAAALVRCSSYEQHEIESALDQALSLAGGLDWVQEGMRVVIKPNLLMKKHPDTACTTHPALIDALTRRLLAKNAQVIIGDSPGGPFTEFWLRAVYDGTKMSQFQQDNVEINYNTHSRAVPYPQGIVLKKVDAAEFILQADAVISFAKLKTHVFTMYTGAVKNLFGVVPGTVKAEYHQRFPDAGDFAQMLVDVAEFVQPRLSIIDAVIGMEGNGPSGGNPRHVGAIIASTSPHEADYIGSALIGLDPLTVPTVKAAIDRGLCPGSIAGIHLQGEKIESLAIPDFKKVSQVSRSRQTSSNIYGRVMKMIFQNNPAVDKTICIGCAACKNACPTQAISMVRNKPDFDRKKCIHCFCCQELCPQTAVYLQRSRLARLLQKMV